jgi:hypothetical protein
MQDQPDASARQRRLTDRPQGHILANRGCWSADGRWLHFDSRADETRFDSPSIDRVAVDSGSIETVHRPADGARCGVPICSPTDQRVVFIRQDTPATDDWPYCAWHRHGAIATPGKPAAVESLDARDLVAPFTPGALRGGTHLHTFHPNGKLLVSTYEDHVLATALAGTAEAGTAEAGTAEAGTAEAGTAEANRRGLAVHLLSHPVTVPKGHPRNRDGIAFTCFVTELTDRPKAGSDQIAMATGESWVGETSQIACQGTVTAADGQPCVELYLVTIPATWLDPQGLRALPTPRVPDRPLEGTPTTRSGTPAGVAQQRLTHTTDRPFPGIFGPRHWCVASPDGTRIGFYMRDDKGAVQFWTVSPRGGDPVQVTHGPWEPRSAFTWHPDGSAVTYIADGSVVWVDVDSGRYRRLTEKAPPEDSPTRHACVFSPDGGAIAFMRPTGFGRAGRFDQIHLVSGWTG